MHEYGFWSIVPPVVAIALAIRTKQVYVSLFAGIWLGWVIINKGNILEGTFDALQGLVDTFKSDGNTKTVMFTLLVGALIAFIQRSGGVGGFVLRVNTIMERLDEKSPGKNRIFIQLLAGLTGILIFVETNISILTVGTLYRPIFDRLKISREKLAYICDSTSSPTSILIPFNAWGAFIMGLLAAQHFDQPLNALFSAYVFNFYPMIALLIVVIVITKGKDIGPMKRAEQRVLEEGKLMAEGSRPMIPEDVLVMHPDDKTLLKARNMIVPIGSMVLLMPFMLIYTGWDSSADPEAPWFSLVFQAIGNGSGSSAVLYSVFGALLIAFLMYWISSTLKPAEMMELSLKGMSGMLNMALLMVFAFAIGNLCSELQTGAYVAEISRNWLSPGLVPTIIFITSSFIAFSTGTSWGTFAIMIAIAVPMSQSFGSNVYLAVAAALGGGVFGDHCSPISDTTIISSMASASDHIDHVRTQLPYALISGVVTIILYLILGFTIG
ncbi:MAG: sodium:solute symporter [Bacteroidetes bacterium]|nr:sodium:solute symporter [Bacteroidota bacterium]MDA1121735.1 sodium:solute symporter [Bacteroidota bacterium]